jgi:hypothetical protein
MNAQISLPDLSPERRRRRQTRPQHLLRMCQRSRSFAPTIIPLLHFFSGELIGAELAA